MIIKNESELRKIYGFPKGRAEKKVLQTLEKHSINFIKKSPFVVLSTSNRFGQMDASPRGGEPGFIKIVGNKLLLPDFKGNNRIDSLINISETNNVGLLFMIPGIDETLRINGTAKISTDVHLLQQFNTKLKSPITCLIISIEEVFLHCAKAFMRSQLWDRSTQIKPDDFPTMGKMLKDQLHSNEIPESRKDMIKRYKENL